MAQSILVVGGNGFLGSTICKAAVAQGWTVASMSSSGKPYTTPAGHTPKWVDRVSWHRASAFEPDTYRDLIGPSTAVVHTLGILLEDAGYKAAIRNNDVFGVIGALAKGVRGDRSPLVTKEEKLRRYEGMNRDSEVLRTTLESSPTSVSSSSATLSPEGAGQIPNARPFVYISAADCFRPLIPRRYIETKREAESEILRITSDSHGHSPNAIRPIFMRPGLMYHPHVRPLSTLPAFALSLSASAHDALRLKLPFPPGGWLEGASTAMRTHPLHVDHVAEAVIRCIRDPTARGVVDVDTMRQWAGFGNSKADKGGVAHTQI